MSAKLRPGLVYMLGSAFAFSVMSLLVKVAGQRLPSQEIVFVRALISLVLSWGLLRHSGVSVWGNQPGLLVLRGVIGFLALSCVYYSMTHNPLSEATVIQYLHPALTVALAAYWLGESVPRRLVFAGPLSLLGLVLVAQPAVLFGSVAAALDPVAVGAAVAGAVLTAAAYVLVRQLAATEHPLVIVFYFPLVTLPASGLFLSQGFVWPQGWDWLVLAGVGLATQAGQVWLTRGLQLEPAGKATAISYFQVVFATVWGLLCFGDLPGAIAIVGGLLLVGSTLVIALEAERT